MRLLLKTFLIFIIITGIFSFNFLVFASHPCISGSNIITSADHLCLPNTATSLNIFFEQIAAFLLKYGMPFVVIFLIIAGFMFVTARGNEEQLTKAKTMLFWTVIGAAIIVGASLMANAIARFGEELSR